MQVPEGSLLFCPFRVPGEALADLAGSSELHLHSLLKVCLSHMFLKKCFVGCFFSSTICPFRVVLVKINSA